MSETKIRGTCASSTTGGEAETGPNMCEYWDTYCYVECEEDYVNPDVCLACERMHGLDRVVGRGFFGESASPITARRD
jgi:hypothetical protein